MYIIIINRPRLTYRSGPFPRVLAPCGPGSWCPRKEACARGKHRLALATRILALLLAPAQVVRQVPLHAKRFSAVVAEVPPAHHVALPLSLSTAWMCLLASLSLSTAWMCLLASLSLSTAWMCLLASLSLSTAWMCLLVSLSLSTAWMCLLASLSLSTAWMCLLASLSLSTAWMCPLASLLEHSLDVSLPLSLSTAWMCFLASLLQHSPDVSPCLSPSAQPGCVFRRNMLVRMALQMWHANLDLLLISVQFRLWPGRKRHHRLLNSRLCCLMSSDVVWHIWDKLRPMPKHGSILLYVHGNQKAR